MNTVVQFNALPGFDYLWKIVFPHRGGSKQLSRVKFDAITGPGLATTMKDTTTGQMISVTWLATPDEVITGYKAFLQYHITESMREPPPDPKYIKTLPFWLNGGCWEDQDLELAERWDRVHGGRYDNQD